MSVFSEIRRLLTLSLCEAAQRYGVTRQLLHDLERGRLLPPAELAVKLEQELGLCGLPRREFLLSARELRDWSRPLPYQMEAGNPEAWLKAEKRWSRLIARLGIHPDTWSWMRRMLPFDSAIEVLTLCLLATLEGQPMLASPHELDFRDQPIVDRHGRALGQRVLPGIRGRLGELRFLLWPQVYLRTAVATYRLDALVLLRCGSKSSWCDMESDGGGHDGSGDEFRRQALGMRELRFSAAEIESQQLVAKLLREAERIFNVKLPPAPPTVVLPRRPWLR